MKERVQQFLTAKVKKAIARIFKIGVSTGFVVVLVKTVPLMEVLNLFTHIDWFYVAVLIVFSYVLLAESCLKWGLLLRGKKIKVSLHYLIKLYVLGNFFNNFLPSMVGGDSARGLVLGRKFGRLTDVFLSIFMERFTGFLALIFITAVTVLIDHPLVRIGNLRTVVLFCSVATVVMIWVIFSRRVFTMMMKLIPAKFTKLRAKIDMAHISLLEFSEDKVNFFFVLLLSLLFHILTGLNLYYACLALHYHPDMLSMIVVTPFILLLSLVPITINGIGLLEGSFVLFFSLLGLPSSLALSVALLFRIKGLIISAIGGIFYLQEGKHIVPTAETSANT